MLQGFSETMLEYRASQKTYQEYADQLGWQEFTDPQKAALYYWEVDIHNELVNPDRMCIFYPTGKGKTAISLVAQKMRGVEDVLIIAPPSTEPEWLEAAEKLGLNGEVISHAKFRLKEYKISRTQAIIVDEFHLLGGHTGQGWKKLDRLAAGLKAPLIVASATPNYNDVERVYCVAHVLDPLEHRGGYQGWLFEHCNVVPHRYRSLPEVVNLKNFESAEEFLANLPGTVYLPDDAPDILQDLFIHDTDAIPEEFIKYGLDVLQPRIMASMMEAKHRRREYNVIERDPNYPGLREQIDDLMQYHLGHGDTPALIYFNHASLIFKAFPGYLEDADEDGVAWDDFAVITGKTSKKKKALLLDKFRAGDITTLVGTATLATGTDGLDKVCDDLFIVDDTDDPSLRRQLVGRILTRGVGGNNDNKNAYRVVFENEG